jgi:hypothetical protein
MDGGEDGPDTLSIFRAELESGAPLGRLSTGYDYSGDLDLADEYHVDILSEGDILALVQGDRAALIEAGPLVADKRKVLVNYNGRFTPPSGTGSSFPAGTVVFNLRDVVFVTYFIASCDDPEEKFIGPCSGGSNNPNQPCLWADYHDIGLDADGLVRMASNIEDFQVFYYFNNDDVDPTALGNDPGMSSRALDVRSPGLKRVKAVGLGMIARSFRPDREAAPSPCPDLFNRKAKGEAVRDQYPRNSLAEIVYLRNF